MKKPVLSFDEQLHSIPIRNKRLKVCDTGRTDDVLVVEVQLRYKGALGGVASFVRARNRKRYELAGISLELFQRLDGRRTVEDLVEWLREKEKLSFLEGRALVLQYLRDLMQRGLIVIVGDDDEED